MLYTVSRDGQTYGPYRLEDLRRFVASGNVLLTDLAKSEEMTEWIPVQQVLGSVDGFAPVASPYPAAASYPAANPNLFQDPPNLSWGLVLLFSFLSFGLFMIVWNLIVSSWMKRVQPSSQAIFFYIGGAILLFINSGTSFGYFIAMHQHHSYHSHPIAGLITVVGWVLRLIARFNMKSSLEAHFNGPEPIGLRLSGIMTFFFGGIYHQYHLNRINEVKRAVRFQGYSVPIA